MPLGGPLSIKEKLDKDIHEISKKSYWIVDDLQFSSKLGYNLFQWFPEPLDQDIKILLLISSTSPIQIRQSY